MKNGGGFIIVLGFDWVNKKEQAEGRLQVFHDTTPRHGFHALCRPCYSEDGSEGG